MTTSNAVARRIEQRSLRFGIGANAAMTLAGFVAHVLTGSTALLLDGLYSAVLVGFVINCQSDQSQRGATAGSGLALWL